MPEQKDLQAIIEKERAKSPEDISVIELVDALIGYAYALRTSDIHINPQEDHLRIRGRVDGVMRPFFTFKHTIQDEIISRIKVLCGLRTDEHQTAQDGRFKFTDKTSGNAFDIRVSIMPTFYGEDAVLRLLAETSGSFSLDSLGFSERDLALVKMAINRPYGMILSTGPTGSGKTTTLYTFLKTLNTESVNIITLEDPVEYSLPGINQIQVNTQAGITFDQGLRSILRQDPNIIMVGEIRDKDTASIAVNAALTGHLLLSTVHTNDAPTVLPRLLDMNIEPFLIASTINLVIGQRLVRKICEACKTTRTLSLAEIQKLTSALPPRAAALTTETSLCFGVGCNVCEKSGYKGRLGIYEVLLITDAIRDAIMKKLNSNAIRDLALHEGMVPILEDGLQKALKGATTIDEVLRVIHE